MKVGELSPIEFVHWAAQTGDPNILLASGAFCDDNKATRRRVERFRNALNGSKALSIDPHVFQEVIASPFMDTPHMARHIIGSRLPWKRALVNVNIGEDTERGSTCHLFFLQALNDDHTIVCCTPIQTIQEEHTGVVMLNNLAARLHFGEGPDPERSGPLVARMSEVCQSFHAKDGPGLDRSVYAHPEFRPHIPEAVRLHEKWAVGTFAYRSDEGGPLDDDSIALVNKRIAEMQAIGRRILPVSNPFSGITDAELAGLEGDDALEPLTQMFGETESTPVQAFNLIATISNHAVTEITLEKRSKRVLIKGKSRKTPDEYVAKIDLGKTVRLVSAEATPTGVHPSRHDVRGHWRVHSRKSYLCDHDWRAFSKQQTCIRCGSRRSWVKDHERGTGEKNPNRLTVVVRDQ